MKKELIIFVGTYTQPILFGTGQILEGKGKGIYCYRVDRDSGALTLLNLSENIPNPSYLTLDKKQQYLYAVNELKEYDGKACGSASAFRLEADFSLTFLSRHATGGTDPCHIAVDPTGSYAAVANFMSGSFCVFPILQDGSIGEYCDFIQHEGSSVHPIRQKGPHAHSVIFSPDGRRAYVPDLGLDRLMAYQMDVQTGKLTPNAPPFLQLEAGAGPRHCVFHPNQKYCYLINELNCTILALEYRQEDGSFTILQEVPTIVGNEGGENICADIQIRPDGKFLYGSNRGCDTLITYAVNSDTGRLTYVDTQSCGGKTPRSFAIDPQGELLIAANQDTDNIVVFRIDHESGKLHQLSDNAVPTPVCVKPYEFAVPSGLL